MIRMIVWLLLIFMQFKPQPYQTVEVEEIKIATVVTNDFVQKPITKIEVHTIEKNESLYSDEEIDLLTLVMLAEAEGESEEGKRLVVDTILNRVDSEHFPDSISEVIYQKNQFSSMWNGRKNQVTITDEARALVCDELEEHDNTEVIFFTAGNYGRYGEPLY